MHTHFLYTHVASDYHVRLQKAKISEGSLGKENGKYLSKLVRNFIFSVTKFRHQFFFSIKKVG